MARAKAFWRLYTDMYPVKLSFMGIKERYITTRMARFR
jgi:hypothetical protein